MAITREQARPGTEVFIRGTVDRTTKAEDQGIDSVLVWVANPLQTRRGDANVSVVCHPGDVTAAASMVLVSDDDDGADGDTELIGSPPPAESILTKLLAAAAGAGGEVATITVDVTEGEAEFTAESATEGAYAIELADAELEYLHPLVAALRYASPDIA